MKKLIVLVIMLLLAGAIGVYFLLPRSVETTTTNIEEESYEEVEVKPVLEVHVKSLESSSTFEITEEEVAYIKNENIIQLDYLTGVYRLLYDYDEENNKLVFVYEDQTIWINFNEASMKINDEAAVDNDLIIKKGGNLYLSLDRMKTLFNVNILLIEDPIFSLKIDLNSDGVDKYLLKEMIDAKIADLPDKINMTWEAVYSRATDVDALYDMPGLNIISPVWYDLEDGSGQVKSKKQDDYIQWANDNGYILWPAVTNGFDPDMTHELITSIDNRSEFISKMVDIYAGNEFHGINIDFENIYKADKDALSQFIAELTAAFHRKGMLVSIDVTFGGGSDNWSKCYDRRILGQWVDFVVVMSYDEHWGSSPVSGSVASLNWLDRNLAILLNEVKSDKVIMGIPFYMRIWFERPSKEMVNSMKVTSDAITMHKMKSILENGDYNVLWDEAAGQNYISFIDSGDNAVKKIWIEDEESLRLKLSMVHKYNLKGIASWRRGYELESIWPMLNEELRK